MTRPTCTGSDVDKHCDRAVVRYREGNGYCLFHPDSEPPAMDPKTGRPLHPTPLKPTVPTVPADLEPPAYRAPGRVVEPETEPEQAVEPEPAPAAAEADPDGLLELQAELDELERTDPTVAAASYDAAVDRVLATPSSPELTVEPADEPETARTEPARPEPAADVATGTADEPDDDGDVDSDDTTAVIDPVPVDLLSLQVAWKVVSSIAGTTTTQPATRHVAREARRALGVLVDQLRHDRATAQPALATTAPATATAPPRRKRGPNRSSVPVDAAEAARRYQDGTPLFDLATELHIGVNRLRTILTDQGVTLRRRGEVVGRRGVEPRPLDVDEAQRLYESGMDSAQVARHLGVKQSRVQDALRERGVLRRALTAAAPLDETRARELYAAGHSLSNVAHALGVRTSRVADLIREHGELRPPGTPTRQPVDA